ncbi:hypothetical protein [Vibrio harveyi]|uniref:hypothetical protein n=1 Tax=Vibrio harveyi TaxID=669 RepID=UPI0006822C9E|nr:hypothetical protein [Vibrio harveyi]
MAKRGRPPRRTKARDKLFFEAIEKGFTQKKAAEFAGYSYSLIMKAKHNDEEFLKSLTEAESIRFEMYKDELHDMVTNGWKEKKIKKTKIGDKEITEIIQTDKRSPQLVVFALKAAEAGRFNFDRELQNDSELDSPPIAVNINVREAVGEVEVTRGRDQP